MENLVYLLVALACPVGMGVMMWFMRGQPADARHRAEPVSLTDLREEQRRLGEEIERLEEPEPHGSPAEAAGARIR